MSSADDAHAELWAYTLGRGDAAFVHQHAVDALGAQRADGRTTPMQLTFALVGLYLYVDSTESVESGLKLDATQSSQFDDLVQLPDGTIPLQIVIENALFSVRGSGLAGQLRMK